MDDGGLAQGLELDGVAGNDVANEVGLGVRIAAIGAGMAGDDGGVELFAELAAQAGDAAFGFLGELLLGGAIVDDADGFAGLVFKVFDQRLEFLLHLADLGAPFLEAFRLEAVFLASHFRFAFAELGALGGDGFELRVEFVEEAGDIEGLGIKVVAGGRDDLGVQADAGSDVDAGGGTGYAQAQFVSRGEGPFVEADGGVEHAGGVDAVDLERGVVGGDEAPGAGVEEVFGDGDGEGGTLFGVGGGAEFVEEDEGGGAGEVRDAVEIDDVGGERGEVLFDGLGVADVGEHAGEEREDSLFGGDGHAGLGEDGEQARWS